jgi:hypothetical protein
MSTNPNSSRGGSCGGDKDYRVLEAEENVTKLEAAIQAVIWKGSGCQLSVTFESKLEPSMMVVEIESKLKSKLEPSTTFKSKLEPSMTVVEIESKLKSMLEPSTTFESKLEPSMTVVEIESKLESKLEPSTTF